MNFEQNMKRLEEIAEIIKEAKVDFKKQVELFAEGADLIKTLEKELSQAEQIIEEIQDGSQKEK